MASSILEIIIKARDTASNTIKQLAGNTQKATDSVEDLNKQSLSGLEKEQKELNETVEKTEEGYGAAEVAAGALGAVGLAGAILASKRLSRVIDQVHLGLERTGKVASAVNDAIGAITGIGFGTIFGTAAIKQSADFGSNITEVATLLDTSEVSIDRVKDAVLDLTNSWGASWRTITPAIYQSVSALGDFEDSVKVVDAALAVSKGGLSTVEEAVNGLTTILNTYELSIDEVTNVSDAFFTAMQGGKTTISELSNTVDIAAATFRGAGLDYTELFAAITVATQGGIETTTALTNLRQLISSLSRDSKELAEVFADVGGSFESALKAEGLIGVLRRLNRVTDGSSAKMLKYLGSIESVGVALALSGNNASRFSRQMEAQADRVGATSEAVEKVAAGLGSQLNDIAARAEAAFTVIAVSASKHLGVFVDLLDQLVLGFNNLALAIPNVLGGLAAFITVATTVGGVLLSIRFGLKIWGFLWPKVSTAVVAATTKLVKFVKVAGFARKALASFAATAGPIGVAFAALSVGSLALEALLTWIRRDTIAMDALRESTEGVVSSIASLTLLQIPDKEVEIAIRTRQAERAVRDIKRQIESIRREENPEFVQVEQNARQLVRFRAEELQLVRDINAANGRGNTDEASRLNATLESIQIKRRNLELSNRELEIQAGVLSQDGQLNERRSKAHQERIDDLQEDLKVNEDILGTLYDAKDALDTRVAILINTTSLDDLNVKLSEAKAQLKDVGIRLGDARAIQSGLEPEAPGFNFGNRPSVTLRAGERDVSAANLTPEESAAAEEVAKYEEDRARLTREVEILQKAVETKPLVDTIEPTRATAAELQAQLRLREQILKQENKLLEEGARAELDLIKGQTNFELDALERRAENGTTSYEDYAAEKLAIVSASYQAERAVIDQQQQALQAETQQRLSNADAALAANIAEAGSDAERQALITQARLQRELINATSATSAAVLDNNLKAMEQKFAITTETIAGQTSDVFLGQMQDKLDTILDSIAAAERRVSAEVEVGLTSEFAAVEELTEARRVQLANLQELIAEMERYNETVKSPEVKEALEDLKETSAGIKLDVAKGSDILQFANDLREGTRRSVYNGVRAALDGSKTFAEAFGETLENAVYDAIANAVVRAADQLLQKGLDFLFGLASPSPGAAATGGYFEKGGDGQLRYASTGGYIDGGHTSRLFPGSVAAGMVDLGVPISPFRALELGVADVRPVKEELGAIRKNTARIGQVFRNLFKEDPDRASRKGRELLTDPVRSILVPEKKGTDVEDAQDYKETASKTLAKALHTEFTSLREKGWSPEGINAIAGKLPGLIEEALIPERESLYPVTGEALGSSILEDVVKVMSKEAMTAINRVNSVAALQNNPKAALMAMTAGIHQSVGSAIGAVLEEGGRDLSAIVEGYGGDYDKVSQWLKSEIVTRLNDYRNLNREHPYDTDEGRNKEPNSLHNSIGTDHSGGIPAGEGRSDLQGLHTEAIREHSGASRGRGESSHNSAGVREAAEAGISDAAGYSTESVFPTLALMESILSELVSSVVPKDTHADFAKTLTESLESLDSTTVADAAVDELPVLALNSAIRAFQEAYHIESRLMDSDTLRAFYESEYAETTDQYQRLEDLITQKEGWGSTRAEKANQSSTEKYLKSSLENVVKGVLSSSKSERNLSDKLLTETFSVLGDVLSLENKQQYESVVSNDTRDMVTRDLVKGMVESFTTFTTAWGEQHKDATSTASDSMVSDYVTGITDLYSEVMSMESVQAIAKNARLYSDTVAKVEQSVVSGIQESVTKSSQAARSDRQEVIRATIGKALDESVERTVTEALSSSEPMTLGGVQGVVKEGLTRVLSQDMKALVSRVSDSTTVASDTAMMLSDEIKRVRNEDLSESVARGVDSLLLGGEVVKGVSKNILVGTATELQKIYGSLSEVPVHEYVRRRVSDSEDYLHSRVAKSLEQDVKDAVLSSFTSDTTSRSGKSTLDMMSSSTLDQIQSVAKSYSEKSNVAKALALSLEDESISSRRLSDSTRSLSSVTESVLDISKRINEVVSKHVGDNLGDDLWLRSNGKGVHPGANPRILTEGIQHVIHSGVTKVIENSLNRTIEQVAFSTEDRQVTQHITESLNTTVAAGVSGIVQGAVGNLIRERVEKTNLERLQSSFVSESASDVTTRRIDTNTSLTTALREADSSDDTPKYAAGGYITGPGTATSDSIDAKLSNGEYVLNAKAVSHYGLQAIEAINRLRVPSFDVDALFPVTRPRKVAAFATGGPVDAYSSIKSNAPESATETEEPGTMRLEVSEGALNKTLGDYLEIYFADVVAAR